MRFYAPERHAAFAHREVEKRVATIELKQPRLPLANGFYHCLLPRRAAHRNDLRVPLFRVEVQERLVSTMGEPSPPVSTMPSMVTNPNPDT
jgi:hypothetical protein